MVAVRGTGDDVDEFADGGEIGGECDRGVAAGGADVVGDRGDEPLGSLGGFASLRFIERRFD